MCRVIIEIMNIQNEYNSFIYALSNEKIIGTFAFLGFDLLKN